MNEIHQAQYFQRAQSGRYIISIVCKCNLSKSKSSIRTQFRNLSNVCTNNVLALHVHVIRTEPGNNELVGGPITIGFLKS